MDWPLFLIFLAATGAAAATGAMFKPGDWYDSLAKPRWTPPNWVFPVAWTVLYLCSAIAATRIAVLPGNAMAMAFWAMQIAFNTLWTPVFFGLRKVKSAMVAMAGLWIAVAGMLWHFWPLDWVAGLLVAPYLLWVTIAASLNIGVIVMNRPGAAAPV